MTRFCPLIAMGSLALASQAGASSWLDDGDRRALEGAAQHSLEFAQTDEPTGWINPDTNSAGTFTPVATHQDADGQVCREYTISGTIGGEQQQIYGVACRQPDGSWREANDASVPPAANRSRYPDRYPDRYRYPDSWRWVVPRISISGAYCDDGFCVGGRYGTPSWFYPSFGLSFRYFDHHGYSGRHYYGNRHSRSHYRGHTRNHFRGGHDRHRRGGHGRHGRGH